MSMCYSPAFPKNGTIVPVVPDTPWLFPCHDRRRRDPDMIALWINGRPVPMTREEASEYLRMERLRDLEREEFRLSIRRKTVKRVKELFAHLIVGALFGLGLDVCRESVPATVLYVMLTVVWLNYRLYYNARREDAAIR